MPRSRLVVALLSVMASMALPGSAWIQMKATLHDPDSGKVEGVLGIAELAGGTLVNMGQYTVKDPFSWLADITCREKDWDYLQMKYADGRPIGSDTHINVVRRKDASTIELGAGTEFQTLSLVGGSVFLIGAPGSRVTLQPGASVILQGAELSAADQQAVTFRIGAKEGKCVMGEIQSGKLRFGQPQPTGEQPRTGGVATDPSAPSGDPSSEALWHAAAGGEAARVRALVAQGADVNARDRLGFSPLMLAASQGHTEIVQTLLERGADPAAGNKAGVTALILAAMKGHIGAMKALLARGAEVDARDKAGFTALILAAGGGQREAVWLLLEQGADMNAKNVLGWTALLMAARNGHTAVVLWLLVHGADVNARNAGGDTALKLASEKGHGAIVQALRRAGAVP